MMRSRKMSYAGYAESIGDTKNVSSISSERPAEKKPLARHRRRWEDNIKIDFKK
jgi:hypothetical protein